MPSQRPPDPDSPGVLVPAAAGGDLDAFARIVRLHHAAMTRTALLVTLDPAMAAEATAEAWETAWPALHRLEDPVRLGPWLGAIAIDEALFLVRHGRTHELPPVGPTRVPVDAELSAILADLSPEDRALLARHHLAGVDAPERARGPLGAIAALGPFRAIGAFRRARRLARLARLSSLVAPPAVTGATADEIADRARARLRAHVDVPVLPVHADQAARRARAETAFERGRVVSVAICAVVGLLVATAPYLVRLAYHHS